ncbi:glycosyltransferase [Pontibacter oryzae]|uniref:Glycosyltransferase n=1 Tax=Pontibacter oryzae TaxID=2304593 RepID=A0A399SDZ5_9BACT|nr:glycosyltransferase [Pontibacter oryzae]RIJ42306.1 glycosyltransferase [Pontibacter oryzae]
MNVLSIQHQDTPAASFKEKDAEKIMFVIQGLTQGGAEFFFISLVNGLKRKGIEPVVLLLSSDNPLKISLDSTIKVYTLTRSFRYDVFISNRIKKIMREEAIKKVFCIGAFSFFLSKLAVLGSPELTFFLSLHTTVPVSKKEHILDTLYLRMLGKRDKVIFICQNQREFYKSKYKYKSDKSLVIYNGIDVAYAVNGDAEQLLTSKASIRQAHGIPDTAPVIIKVANLRQEKGHFYAVDALQLLHEKHNCSAHMFFVGGGQASYSQKLTAYIAEKGLAGHIHLVGPKDDVRPYLSASDIFTLTSYSVETFSIAALEAMSFGLPCCLTKIGGASEMVAEDKTGLLCRAKDTEHIAASWHKLLTGNYDRTYIQNYVRSKFSSTTMVQQYHDVLQT